MQSFDFSPFYRSTVGFDRLFNRLDATVGQETKSYPPYNIERLSEDAWCVSIAVAGFTDADIVVETKENGLTVKGAKTTPDAETSRQFLHRGIAERDFDLRFQLGEYVEVTSANLENGLLNIELKLDVPEHKKARQIEIKGGDTKTTIEDQTVN